MMEDLGNEELNYAQIKAMALSEPLMKSYVQKENELRRARLVLRQEEIQREQARKALVELREMPKLPPEREAEIPWLEAQIAYTSDIGEKISELEAELAEIFEKIKERMG